MQDHEDEELSEASDDELEGDEAEGESTFLSIACLSLLDTASERSVTSYSDILCACLAKSPLAFRVLAHRQLSARVGLPPSLI